jgi:hypothetical protein
MQLSRSGFLYPVWSSVINMDLRYFFTVLYFRFFSSVLFADDRLNWIVNGLVKYDRQNM